MKKLSTVSAAILAVLLLGFASQAQAFFFSFGFGGGSWGYPYYSGWGYPGYWSVRHYRNYAYRPYYARRYWRSTPYYARAFGPLPLYTYPAVARDTVISAPRLVEK